MTVIVPDYPHRTGEHCASTAMRNLLAYHGLPLSEGMVFGLASGLGFFYLDNDALSPTRMFHGRTATLEVDFAKNTGIAQRNGTPEDDEVAWADLRARLDEGIPVMLSTDTFYLGYQNTTSHFPGHRAVAIGYDEAQGVVLVADRKLEDVQRVPLEEVRRARNADDYPMSCRNEFDHFRGRAALARPLVEAIRRAIVRNVEGMRSVESSIPGAAAGIPGMRRAAEALTRWSEIDDWSWAARFGYQVVVKRGAGGCFFRSLYADFLRESAAEVPALGEAGVHDRMARIAEDWVAFSMLLKEQSEREHCNPALFEEAGRALAALAEAEEGLFGALDTLARRDEIWRS